MRPLLVLLAACSTDAPPPPPPPAPPAPAPAPVAKPPRPGEAMEILELACPGPRGAEAAAVESALRQRAHALRACFTATATATVELGGEGVRSIVAPSPELRACLGHALRRARLPETLLAATCTVAYQLTR